MKKRWFAIGMFCALGAVPALAQFPEDALRLGQTGFGVGARALGMGNAYTGVASDYSAIYWNPAGLSQAQHAEFSIGMSYNNLTDKSTFFGNQLSSSTSATNLNALGIVYPIPVRRGSMALAIGYQRQSVFAAGLDFNGFNPTSSYLQSSAPDGQQYPSDLSNNLAYQLYLANIDTLTGRFISPIKNRVTQIGNVLEGGGLNNWSVAGAVDIGRDLSAGVTLTYLSGSYRYDRNYTETDANKIYDAFPFDFSSLELKEFIDSDISGVNAKFGLMYRAPGRFRLGFSVKTPTAFTIHETYGTSASAYFDNGDVRPTDAPFKTNGATDYDVRTPWEFGIGASWILNDLVLAGDFQFADWTTLEFSNPSSDLQDQNQIIKSSLRETWNYRVGAEYDILGSGFRLRGGYGVNASPYKNDPKSFDRQFLTGGIGILLDPNAMLDIGYMHGWWKTYRVNYDNTSRVDESNTTNTLLATLTYRF
jgi:long-subunit fatty acid transport protein